jgi:hypothetical protein
MEATYSSETSADRLRGAIYQNTEPFVNTAVGTSSITEQHTKIPKLDFLPPSGKKSESQLLDWKAIIS